MENEKVKTIGDISGKELITDIQWATIMFERGQTVTLGMNLGEVVDLRDAAIRLTEVLNKELENLHPDLRTRLEEEKNKTM